MAPVPRAALQGLLVGLFVALAALPACDGCGAPSEDELTTGTSAAAGGDPASDAAPSLSGGPSPSASAPEPPPPRLVHRCPTGMALVAPAEEPSMRFCIDRWEATVLDDRGGGLLSPYWAPNGKRARYLHQVWTKRVAEATDGTALARSTPLPDLPEWQRSPSLVPRAAPPRPGLVPQGYVSGEDARLACERAGKRLCLEAEWRRACRGEEDHAFPYGDAYEPGACNVFREAHPGVLLYENPSINHTDPRFNRVGPKEAPLLRRTGATPRCVSRWGDDEVYDMVGNLDEWVDDPEGTFVGGFYARAKKDGCASTVRSHGFDYSDYSTGFRCCAAPELVPDEG